jgi:surface polysaccharide O-acyltransferase-like enzyme
MKQRNLSLDVVRSLACIMVVAMHSPMPGIGISGYLASSISFFTAPCIGLFFMVSGALSLPAKDDAKTFLTHRFSKIIFPTLFWSLFYIAVSYISRTKEFDIQSLLHQLFSIPFSAQGNGVLWFMYTLAGLYLITPIISPWIKTSSKGQMQFYLSLWLVSMCYPLLKYVVDVNDSNTGILYYFSGYVGYFVLGYYLKHYQPQIPRVLAIALLLIPISIAVICKLMHLKIDFYSLFWYLSVLTVMMCIAWYALLSQSRFIESLSNRFKLLIVNFSNYSFGIYLIHIFIMRNCLWNCELLLKLGGVFHVLITIILTITLSYIMVRLIARLPFADYLIGYKQSH